MRRKSVFVFAASLILVAVVSLPGQNAPAQSKDEDYARRAAAIGLIRTINTTEVAYHTNHTSFAPWDLLLVSPEFNAPRVIQRTAQNYPALVGAQFSNGSEILPGWFLRLNVTTDGQAYDVMLTVRAEKETCAYTVFTNESGVIWQATALGCENREKSVSAEAKAPTP